MLNKAKQTQSELSAQSENVTLPQSWTLKPLLSQLDKPQTQPPKNQMKYLILCGSTISGIGKGSTMSALGVLFQSCGLRVTCVKVDPYLNIDAGTMSPYEHGEVFVLDDGGEVDLDLGNYERSLRLTFTQHHNITSGKVFASVINGERSGTYLGKTVQIVPHVTDKIKSLIEKAAYHIVEKDDEKQADICLIEIGGTVGDLESGIFYEAIRQFIFEVGSENCAIALISYVPELGEGHEQKTKPTQFGIKELKSMGLFPNFLVCRSEHALEKHVIDKIAFGANLSSQNIISCCNVNSLWDVPLLLASQNLHFRIMDHLQIPLRNYKIHKWLRLSEHIRRLKSATEVKIAVCGKYINNTDTYYSVMKSLQDAAYSANRNLVIEWLDCTVFDTADHSDAKETFWKTLEGCHGILVPGGFGSRGVEGMIRVCRYARENLIPYFGICLGMQVAVIEFCRNVLQIEAAHSKEFADTKADVITTMDDTNYQTLGGTLRKGAKSTVIKDKESLAYKIYGRTEISERHRHRYEVNPEYVKSMEAKGMIFSGKDPDSERMNIAEIPTHPFFFCTQYHPEFKTNPFNPTPIFYSFLLASSKQYDRLRTYFVNHVPGISALEHDEESEIVYTDEKYEKMIKKILDNHRIFQEIIKGNVNVDVNVDVDVDVNVNVDVNEKSTLSGTGTGTGNDSVSKEELRNNGNIACNISDKAVINMNYDDTFEFGKLNI